MNDPIELADQPRPPAGWYPDPDQPVTQRYWDGSAWTEQRAPLQSGGVGTGVVVGGLCVAGVLVGSIGPWVDAGFVSAAGTDGDGVITLVLGLIALLSVVGAARRAENQTPTVAGVFGGLAAALAIYHIVDIYSQGSSRLFGQEVQIARPGWGLWLTAVAGAGLALLSLTGTRASQR